MCDTFSVQNRLNKVMFWYSYCTVLLAEENQEGLTLNAIHRRLVYADVVD